MRAICRQMYPQERLIRAMCRQMAPFLDLAHFEVAAFASLAAGSSSGCGQPWLPGLLTVGPTSSDEGETREMPDVAMRPLRRWWTDASPLVN